MLFRSELWLAAIVEEDRARVGEEFAASLAGAPYDTKYRVIVEGEIRWLHARARVQEHMVAGLRMIGVCEDVTREETLARELDRAQRRLAVAQEASGAVSFDWDSVKDEVVWNSGNVFGWPAAELKASAAYFAHVHPDDRASLSQAVTVALQEGHGYYIEFRLFAPDGSIRWISSSARPLKNEQGT